ncbi:ribosomal protein S18 acetylase RimI-like enzyme [Pseudoduganella flava]|uniref:GNAT family N-acetyltransferase n=1 Tax=Pseudoduganella flava TaxID=871742 RepID=A0A562Q146_9BURK|nr:GNAT family N-acetyltransferase [Pseudoduganella flava]QGZ38102.1 GNAT family N-acetyltransferase [Pseudoduganella flava]TWI50384.1 ribosomal protein S18 acetylase RimI-like enzyme [Pseudoduganella flava]
MSNTVFAPLTLRALAPGDLPHLLNIQLACYGPDFIESADVYARRLASAVNCSLVCERAGAVCAYLAAYRSVHGKVTPLHGEFEPSERTPDTLYLHDMAVLPAYAGQGLAQALLERLWEQGRAWGLRHTALVSVQDTEGFWARHGYVPQSLLDEEERARLASYGAGAVYMARPLASV